MILVSLIAAVCVSACMPDDAGASTQPVTAQPRVPLARYVSLRHDYPAAALRNREQGQVYFALGIGADGRVNACRITGSSGSAALDSATCRIMRSRARYTPARDIRGVAVADVGFGDIRWTLPAG